MRSLRDRVARIEARARRVAERGNERHGMLGERLEQIEHNTARIDQLAADLAAHIADGKRHTGKAK